MGEQIRQRHLPALPLPLGDGELAQMRHSMTGQRFSGCSIWQPALLADGAPMRSLHPEADGPLLRISYKSDLMGISTPPRSGAVYAKKQRCGGLLRCAATPVGGQPPGRFGACSADGARC